MKSNSEIFVEPIKSIKITTMEHFYGIKWNRKVIKTIGMGVHYYWNGSMFLTQLTFNSCVSEMMYKYTIGVQMLATSEIKIYNASVQKHICTH